MVQPLPVSGMVRKGKLSGVECGGIDNESRYLSVLRLCLKNKVSFWFSHLEVFSGVMYMEYGLSDI